MQLIAWKDPSLKWPVMCLVEHWTLLAYSQRHNCVRTGKIRSRLWPELFTTLSLTDIEEMYRWWKEMQWRVERAIVISQHCFIVISMFCFMWQYFCKRNCVLCRSVDLYRWKNVVALWCCFTCYWIVVVPCSVCEFFCGITDVNSLVFELWTVHGCFVKVWNWLLYFRFYLYYFLSFNL